MDREDLERGRRSRPENAEPVGGKGKKGKGKPHPRQRPVPEVEAMITPIRSAGERHAGFRDGRRHVNAVPGRRVRRDHVDLCDHAVGVLLAVAVGVEVDELKGIEAVWTRW